MKKHFIHFVPGQYNKMAAWAANYKVKIGEYGAQVGLSPEAITAQQAAAQKIVDVVNNVQQKKSEQADAVSAQKLLYDNEVKLIRDAVTAYKKNPGFTDNIGNGLGVMTTSFSLDESTLKPILKPTTYPGYVSLSFNKQRMYGVTIFSRLKGATDWTELASIRTSPYKDVRPLAEAGKPEHREYMAMCYNGEIDLGQQSNIVSVVFGG